MWEVTLVILALGVLFIGVGLAKMVYQRRARKRLQRAAEQLENIARENRMANDTDTNNSTNPIRPLQQSQQRQQLSPSLISHHTPLPLSMQRSGERVHAIPIQVRSEAVFVNGALVPRDDAHVYGTGHYLPRSEDMQESKVYEEEDNIEEREEEEGGGEIQKEVEKQHEKKP
ncbi:uncharacterized protein TM35_000262020 [Trypanosoma theileri]|uniref:Uncharacterized protein n=1 Tax=Trypanosoma theileri TaxID=67003 RepID=A0A1X0NRL1_9TRYP|nr:uncharacterized protein TM35_000262020 [Trypanosoma theileri]ORC86750.1 hypothetical protein TM35_000262020 [Trypanosoma theileri]